MKHNISTETLKSSLILFFLTSLSDFLPCKVCHLHHDHTHLLGHDNDIVPAVVPLGHLSVQFHFVREEFLDLHLDLLPLLCRQLPHHGSVTLTQVIIHTRHVTRYWRNSSIKLFSLVTFSPKTRIDVNRFLHCLIGFLNSILKNFKSKFHIETLSEAFFFGAVASCKR